MPPVGSGEKAGPDPYIIGFAQKPENETAHALRNFSFKKPSDFIVLNSLENDAGANSTIDTNKVRFLFPDNKALGFLVKSKQAVAADIVQQLGTFGPFK